MSSTKVLKRRQRMPADPERAYQEWAGALRERLPVTDWDDVEARPPRDWLWAAELADTPGGPGLADSIQGVAAEDMDERVVLELIAGCERVKSWAAAKQAELITELHTRATGSPAPVFIDDELRMRLGITGYSAEIMEGRARELAEYPEVLTALRAGWIDVRKADVFCRATTTLAEAEARAIHRAFLPLANELTAPQLRKKLTKAALALDPDLAQERHEQAKDSRTVSLIPSDDGMAWLSVFLPAPEAMAAFTAIDTLAAEGSAADPRSIGARRADAFSQVLTETLERGTTPGGCALGTRQGARPHLMITITAGALAGEDKTPAYLEGYGPITAAAARKYATDQARYTTIITDPTDGSYLGQHEGRPEPDSSYEQYQRPRTYSPHTWEKYQARLSAHNAQYLIDQVEAAASADPVLHLRSLGLLAADSYTPNSELRRYLVMRDRSCRFPGCQVPGWKCQIDHIQPFNPARPAWAQTVETNLHLLCRHHHQLKTSGSWRTWRDSYGATHWVTSSGFHQMVRKEEIHPRDEADLFRVALAGLKAELGPDIDHLNPRPTSEPGCADEYHPRNLALEDDLEVIAEKLREATSTGPAVEPGPHRSSSAAQPGRSPERGLTWAESSLNPTPRRASPPAEDASSGNSAGSATDEDDRPPF